jgi:hypothetical protein
MPTRTITGTSNDVTRIIYDIETVTADLTLTAADSGKWYALDNTTGKTITLPAVQAGLQFKFYVADNFATDNFIIDSAEGDNIDGSLVVNGAKVAAAGEDQINFVASAETKGDFVELWSDGNQWFVYGVGANSGSITATDPS